MTDRFAEYIEWIRKTDPLPDGAGVFDGVVREVFGSLPLFSERDPRGRTHSPRIDLLEKQRLSRRQVRNRLGHWRLS